MNEKYVPSDFVTLIDYCSVPEVKFPWRYQHGRFVLQQHLFYENSSWRLLTIYFDFSKGFSFQSRFYPGSSDGSNFKICEITKDEYHSRHKLQNGKLSIDLIEDNDPKVLDWLEKRGVIQSVSSQKFEKYQDIWACAFAKWHPGDIASYNKMQLGLFSQELCSYFELGNKCGEENFENNIRIYKPFVSEWDDQFSPLTDTYSSDSLFIPSKEGTSEWKPALPNVLRTMYLYKIDGKPFHSFAYFDFSDPVPVFRLSDRFWKHTDARNQITAQSAVWSYHYLEDATKVLQHMLNTKTIVRSSSFNRDLWEKQARIKLDGFVKENNAFCSSYNVHLNDSEIVRW